MPLPLVPIVAIAAAGLVGIGSVGAKRRLGSKTLLLVGSPASGKDSITQLFAHTDSDADDPWHQRVRDHANKLIGGKLDVIAADVLTEGDLGTVSAQVSKADLVCLVVTTREIHETTAIASTTRLAKLIGELAGKRTKSLLVVNDEGSPTGTELVARRDASSTTTISDLIGASQVWEGNFDKPSALADLAETILSVLTTKQ